MSCFLRGRSRDVQPIIFGEKMKRLLHQVNAHLCFVFVSFHPFHLCPWQPKASGS